MNLNGKEDGGGSWNILPSLEKWPNTAESDPTEKDGDGDGMADGYEVWFATLDPRRPLHNGTGPACEFSDDTPPFGNTRKFKAENNLNVFYLDPTDPTDAGED